MTGTDRGTRPRRPRPDQPLRARWDPAAALDEQADGESGGRRKGWFATLVEAYGWRVFAIPVLVVLTVWLIVVTVRSPGTDDSPSGRGEVRNPEISQSEGPIGAPAGDVAEDALPLGALPNGGVFAETGERTYRVVPGTGARVGTGPQEYTYTVEIENGLPRADYNSTFAVPVTTTLADPRSWIGGNEVSFRRVDGATEPDLRITLVSSGTARELCGYQIEIESSCFYPPEGRVVINQARWERGALAFEGDIGLYRQYLINHEVGHGIGYEHHVPCPANGALAPIMMQQTFGVANSDIVALDPDMPDVDRSLVCRPNAWAFPSS